MNTEADPIVGNWYQHLDKGQKFFVVAYDEDHDLVQIQYFDGDLEEIDTEQWYRQDIEPTVEPENWIGPADVTEIDDLGNSVTDTTADDWNEPLTEVRKSDRENEQLITAEQQDDWDEGSPQEEQAEKQE